MSHCHFRHPLTHYAKVYGTSYRTILRWKERGYPLDDEVATRALVASQKNSPAPSSPGNASRTVPTSEPGSLGLSASIKRLQEAEAAAHADYLDALKNGSDAQATQRRKDWLALSEQLRRVEQSTPDVEAATGKTVRLDELQAVLNEFMVRLRQDLETVPARIALELVGKDEIGIRTVLETEVESIISALYGCEYLREESNG